VQGTGSSRDHFTTTVVNSIHPVLLTIPFVIFMSSNTHLLSIYIKAKRAGWLAGGLDVFVCVLLGSGGLLLCSGGVFFGVRSGGNDIFDIYDCCYAAGAFSLGSVLGPLLGNDSYIKSSIFFGVCSGSVAWKRQ
jgi:hypothetical protein